MNYSSHTENETDRESEGESEHLRMMHHNNHTVYSSKKEKKYLYIHVVCVCVCVCIECHCPLRIRRILLMRNHFDYACFISTFFSVSIFSSFDVNEQINFNRMDDGFWFLFIFLNKIQHTKLMILEEYTI